LGVTEGVVHRWRKALGVTRTNNPGTMRLQRVASERGASRDGRQVAAGSFGGAHGVCVWEADTGRPEKELPVGDADIAFSPDGRWLYAATGRLSPRGAECCAWRVGTWEADRRQALNWTPGAPPSLAVTADGAILAVPNSPDVLRLLEAASFAPRATLTAPEPGFMNRHTFSPDGRLLAATASSTIHLWDLTRLNEHLADLGLDWQRPRSPPQPPPSPRPLRVEIVPMPAGTPSPPRQAHSRNRRALFPLGVPFSCLLGPAVRQSRSRERHQDPAETLTMKSTNAKVVVSSDWSISA
jgi:hypothetical protein